MVVVHISVNEECDVLLEPVVELYDIRNDPGLLITENDGRYREIVNDLCEKYQNLIDPFDTAFFAELLEAAHLSTKNESRDSLPIMGELLYLLTALWGKQVQSLKNSVNELSASLSRLNLKNKDSPISRSTAGKSKVTNSPELGNTDDLDNGLTVRTDECRIKSRKSKKTFIASEEQISGYLGDVFPNIVLRRRWIQETFQGLANGETLDFEFNIHTFYNSEHEHHNLQDQSVAENFVNSLREKMQISEVATENALFNQQQTQDDSGYDTAWTNTPASVINEADVSGIEPENVEPAHIFTEEECQLMFTKENNNTTDINREPGNKVRKKRSRVPFESLDNPTVGDADPEIKRARVDDDELNRDISDIPLGYNKDLGGESCGLIENDFGGTSSQPETFELTEVNFDGNLGEIPPPPSPLYQSATQDLSVTYSSSRGIDMKDLVGQLTETAMNLINGERREFPFTDLLHESRLNIAGVPTNGETNDDPIISVPLAFMAVLQLAVTGRFFLDTDKDGSCKLTKTKPLDHVPSREHQTSQPKI